MDGGAGDAGKGFGYGAWHGSNWCVVKPIGWGLQRTNCGTLTAPSRSFPSRRASCFWTWPAQNLKPADMLNLGGKYHTNIVLEIAKSYKRITLYDGRKVNLLFSAAREGHQKRRSQTPIPHTTVLLSTLFCGKYLLLPCFALPQRVRTCLSSLTFLLAGKT